MRQRRVSNNYEWLEHNQQQQSPPNDSDGNDVDTTPTSSIPEEYRDMPIQPFGHQPQSNYDELIRGCQAHYQITTLERDRRRGGCEFSETDRIGRSVRQPMGVYNYTTRGYHKRKAPSELLELIRPFWKANKHQRTSSTNVETWEKGCVFVL